MKYLVKLSFLVTLLSLNINFATATPLENKALSPNIVSTSIVGIREGEIFQRDMPQNSAQITVSLKTPPSTIIYKYYTISLLNDFGVRQSVLVEGAYNGSSLLTFSLPPQSKFRKIRLSFYDNKSVELLRWDSPSFNVGEVFIVAGQSNVANHGDTEGNTEEFTGNNLSRMVDPTNPNVWTQLKAPMLYATSWDYPRTGSPWPSFVNDLGTKLASNPRYGDVSIIPIAIVNVAYGGSSIEVWNPKATTDQNGTPMVLFNRLLLAANVLKHYTPTSGVYSCGFRAVLWHQGESNSNRDFNTPTQTNIQELSRKSYANQLKNIAQSFRNSSGCTAPWMVAKASWLAPHWRTDAKFNPDTKFSAETEIREGQMYLPNRLRLNNNEPVFYAGPDTDLLTGDDPALPGVHKAYRSDGIHMNRLGLKLHGKLWSSYVANMIDPNNQVLLKEKDIVPEVNTVYNTYINALNRTPEEVSFDNEGMRYWTQALTLHPEIKNDMYKSFLNSDERYVRDTFQKTVGRRPTWWEVNYWVGELASGRTTKNNLAANDRVGFENTLTQNGKKVFLLYVNILGRRLPDILADTNGFNYWLNFMNSNSSSESYIQSAFYSSTEYRVRNAFIKAKGRQPNYNELISYMSQVNSNTTDAWLIDNVFNNAVN